MYISHWPAWMFFSENTYAYFNVSMIAINKMHIIFFFDIRFWFYRCCENWTTYQALSVCLESASTRQISFVTYCMCRVYHSGCKMQHDFICQAPVPCVFWLQAGRSRQIFCSSYCLPILCVEAPHVVRLPFGVPMGWREQQNHHEDCYFCLTNIKGINRRNKLELCILIWSLPIDPCHTMLTFLF